jgi:hypothetical protein
VAHDPPPPFLPRSGVRPTTTLLHAPSSSTGPPPLSLPVSVAVELCRAPSSPSIAAGGLPPLAYRPRGGNERGTTGVGYNAVKKELTVGPVGTRVVHVRWVAKTL